MESSLVTVDNLSKRYGKHTALSDVSLAIPAGEILSVIGTNGAGKTTLLHLLAGMLFPTAGTISVNGLDRWKQNFEIRHFTTVVPANALPVGESNTPADYLRFIGQIYGMTVADIDNRTAELAAEMHFVDQLGKTWDKLSLGNSKKALLIGAFLPNAKLRILDEPFAGGIDPPGMEALYSWMVRAREFGETTVFSTQVLDQAEEFSDRILLLDNGRIKFIGTPAALLESTNTPADAPRPLTKAFMALAGKD